MFYVEFYQVILKFTWSLHTLETVKVFVCDYMYKETQKALNKYQSVCQVHRNTPRMCANMQLTQEKDRRR